MEKTAKQIQGDIYRMLKESNLATMITGQIYRNGYRPRDSRKEDAVVIFTTGTSGQRPAGVITINIFVPDIDPYANGLYVEDGQRTEQLESAALQWTESLTTGKSDYKFSLQQTIYTEEEPDIHQHFIVVKLKYEYLNI